jgi:hypothetical protein
LFEAYYEIQDKFDRDCRFDKTEDIIWSWSYDEKKFKQILSGFGWQNNYNMVIIFNCMDKIL